MHRQLEKNLLSSSIFFQSFWSCSKSSFIHSHSRRRRNWMRRPRVQCWRSGCGGWRRQGETGESRRQRRAADRRRSVTTCWAVSTSHQSASFHCRQSEPASDSACHHPWHVKVDNSCRWTRSSRSQEIHLFTVSLTHTIYSALRHVSHYPLCGVLTILTSSTADTPV